MSNDKNDTTAIVKVAEHSEALAPVEVIEGTIIEIPTTAEVLADMLRENTGTHFLDSGGAYGRHWQRNRARDFAAEPQSTFRVNKWGIEVTHSVYHWLLSRLDYDHDATQAFEAFKAERDPENEEHGMAYTDEFPAYFAERYTREQGEPCDMCEQAPDVEDTEPEESGADCDADCQHCVNGLVIRDTYEATGIYGDGEPLTVNSYNGEDLLSQVIQYTYFELRDAPLCTAAYVVLSIHGGCDVRGGYTEPKVFQVDPNHELGIFDNAKANIWCDSNPEDHNWYTDDGCHWYYQGAAGYGAGAQLETYDRVRLTDEGEEPSDGESTEWVKGVLCYRDNGEALCPHCGGLLKAGFY